VLRVKAGPAQDASERVGYEVAERTPHQQRRCSRSRRYRVSVLPTQRAHAAFDGYRATSPAICTAPAVPAKAPPAR
jgi:hypothetical protein